MSKVQMIAAAFDLQKRNKLCNIKGCEKLPVKRILLFEENRITMDRKNIATLYLCSEHNDTRMPAFMTEINKYRERGKIIDKRVHDVGFLTY